MSHIRFVPLICLVVLLVGSCVQASSQEQDFTAVTVTHAVGVLDHATGHSTSNRVLLRDGTVEPVRKYADSRIYDLLRFDWPTRHSGFRSSRSRRSRNRGRKANL